MTTKEKQKNSKRPQLAFIIIFLVLCLIPFVCMPVFGNQQAESDDSELKAPRLIQEDKVKKTREWNEEYKGLKIGKYLEDLGEYFSKKFAFRRQLVDGDARLVGMLFHRSTQDDRNGGVKMGKAGWLFYTNDLPDYLGQQTLTDYQIASVAYNLKLTQDQLKQKGINFVFAIAPNKAGLYPQNLRGEWKTDPAGRNAKRLQEAMEKVGVNYVDLFSLFTGEEEVLYHKTDSHWNNKGAAMVNKALLAAVGMKATDYSEEPYEERYDFQGDLFKMLYPAEKDREREIYYDRGFTYSYEPLYTTGEVVKDSNRVMVQTKNPDKEGSLVMIRDSFGISLLPFTAEDVGKGYFTRETPYDLQSAAESEIKADALIFELVERNLKGLLDSRMKWLMPAEKERILIMPTEGIKGSAKADKMDEDKDPYPSIRGTLDPNYITEETQVYACLSGPQGQYLYPAFRVNGDENGKDTEYGFFLYFDPEMVREGTYDIHVIYKDDEQSICTESLGSYTSNE